MIYTALSLTGTTLIIPEPTRDERGYFVRLIDYAEMSERGLETQFEQESLAFNKRAGTLRGLHYQREPFGETKLVRCTRGSVYDVLLDVRKSSATYGKWMAIALHATEHTTLYVPAGFAHGYQTLQDATEVCYQITPSYEPSAVAGFHHADPALAIPWPIANAIVSERDRQFASFA